MSSESLNIKLHPLVILNVSDHHARANSENKEDDDREGGHRVIGALFGVQTGRNVEVLSSFEITYRKDAKGIQINKDFFLADIDLYKKVYPTHEFLGWYTTGVRLDVDQDFILHKVFTEHNESPLLFLLNPTASSDSKELPINIYEAEVHMVHDAPKTEFVDRSYTVVTEEAERITVDHVVKVQTDETTGSVLTPQFQNMNKAVGMLNQRIEILHTFLCDVKSGKVKGDQNVLRAIKGVCNRLPTMDSASFKQDFLSEYNDALLITFLASMTKGSQQINGLVDKFATAFERGGRGRLGMEF